MKSITRPGFSVLHTGLLLLVFQAANAADVVNIPKATQAKAPVVSGAFAHTTVPGQRVGAAYMTITSPYSTTLRRIESGAAEYVEVHQMHKQDGVMKMREIKELKIPAGAEVKLAPGGAHLMLIQLKKPLKQGETVPLKMVFTGPDKKDVQVLVNAPVRPLGQ